MSLQSKLQPRYYFVKIINCFTTSESSGNNPVTVLEKLPKFDGRSSIKKFLKSIYKRSTLESCDDERKAAIVRNLCTDMAEAFIDSHPELENSSYKELCVELNKIFKSKITKSEACGILMSIRQEHCSIAEYAGKIERSAADLSEIITELTEHTDLEKWLISIFINGLSQIIKRLLISVEYDEFSDLVRAAKQCEQTLSETRRAVSVVGTVDYFKTKTEQLPLWDRSM